MKEHSKRRPMLSLRTHVRRLVRQHTSPEPRSVRHQGLMCSALSFGLIATLAATCLVMPGGVAAAPSAPVLATMLAGCGLNCALLLGFYVCESPRATSRLMALTWTSIGLNSALVAVLSILSWGQDNQYYVLMVVPVLQAAISFDLGRTLAVLLVAVLLNFLGAYPLDWGEWSEAAAGSVIFILVAVVVWLLVNSLRDRESRLKQNLEELALTREQLLAEEKLAAIGRLASAIAHEIRNPIAMISSSLLTAARNGQSESDKRKLFDIAASEAGRLERLTSDFLNYARAREIRIARANIADTLHYIAGIARAHPENRGVTIAVEADERLDGEFDVSQLQQALLNIAMNAIDACEPADAVTLRAARNDTDSIEIQVIDPAGPIPADTTARIFEPFFTTKANGTGLGLAIARNIARAHGGDLVLSINQPGQVCFSIVIPQPATRGQREERAL
jgi:two-component system, NtrC family, sensor histidine kinase HydH